MIDEQKRTLRKLDRVLMQFRTAIDPNVPAQLAQTFVAVALNEGASLTEIANVVGTALSTASRHLADLGDRNRKKESGYKLVHREQDAMELRKNIYTLTPKGRLLAEALAHAMKD
jgi:DNA-binding MarR family transcriptional regulator